MARLIESIRSASPRSRCALARLPAGDLFDDPPHALVAGIDLAKKPHFACAAALSHRHRIAELGHVDPDENLCMLFHGSPSCAEDRPGQSGQPSPRQCRASRLSAAGGHTVLRSGRRSFGRRDRRCYGSWRTASGLRETTPGWRARRRRPAGRTRRSRDRPACPRGR